MCTLLLIPMLVVAHFPQARILGTNRTIVLGIASTVNPHNTLGGMCADSGAMEAALTQSVNAGCYKMRLALQSGQKAQKNIAFLLGHLDICVHSPVFSLVESSGFRLHLIHIQISNIEIGHDRNSCNKKVKKVKSFFGYTPKTEEQMRPSIIYYRTGIFLFHRFSRIF